MPCTVFACEANLCVKSTRCPRGGTPVLLRESSSTIPPQKSLGSFYFQPVLGRLPKIPIGHKLLKTSWNLGMNDSERQRFVSLHSNQSNRLDGVKTHPEPFFFNPTRYPPRSSTPIIDRGLAYADCSSCSHHII